MSQNHGLKIIMIPLILINLLLVIADCKPSNRDNNGNNNNNNGNNSGNTENISKWDLWTNGTRLRGVNIYQRKVYPELDGPEIMGNGIIGPPFTQKDFDRLAEMGCNYVNLSHTGTFEENPPYTVSEAIFDHLSQLIEMIGNADMFAVISFRTGPGRSEFTFFWGEDEDWFDESYYNDTVWTVREAQDAWVEMWQETARRFKDHPNVVGYDLMVEPNANEVWFDMWEPDEYYRLHRDTLFDWNSLYSRITTSIREVDSTTPILIGGMGYSNLYWLPYLETTGDKKTVFTFHQYTPDIYTHQEPPATFTYPGFMDADWDGEEEYVDKSWLENLLTVVDEFIAANQNQVVVGCNEYGVMRWVPGNDLFMDDLMNIFEQKGLNYALWEWSCSYEPYVTEVNDFNFRYGTEPNNTVDIDTNPLTTVLKKYWELNTYRPSTVTFRTD